jgi:nucleolar protein 12
MKVDILILLRLQFGPIGPPKLSTAANTQRPRSRNGHIPDSKDAAEESDTEMQDASRESSVENTINTNPTSLRKKRKRNEVELEDLYMRKLEQEEQAEATTRRSQNETGNNADENKPSESSEEDDGTSADDLPILHESVAKGSQRDEYEAKLKRTVFLSNVSSSAITSKSDKKALLAHLSSFLTDLPDPKPKIESIRFRSTAFSTPGIPKRAAYALKEVHDQTTKSTNAYVVYSDESCVKEAAKLLNGTVVLDRHIRVDSAAKPAPTDNRRCVFVGNLDFVDDEPVGEDGEAPKRRKRSSGDPEEGLWQAFSKIGKVENVRVIRDPITRVGKGIAYVQFEDPNAVEAALLYDGKNFAPLLPRKIRVTRAKRITNSSKPQTTLSDQKHKGARPADRFKPSRFASRDQRAPQPKVVVFEGHRASASAPVELRKPRIRKGGKPKPTTRSARRGSDWKATQKDTVK